MPPTTLWLKMDPQPTGFRAGWYTDYLANRSFAGWMDEHGATTQHETPHRIGDTIDHNGQPHRVESISVGKPCDMTRDEWIASLNPHPFERAASRIHATYMPSSIAHHFGDSATDWHWKITLTPEPQS